ncbi:MAG: hypothetical protein M1814_001835 [Vezdaea aestivalis]|nr:MAG: hypothetical protein M1814_001835 [Vezdaea aestivalis]
MATSTSMSAATERPITGYIDPNIPNPNGPNDTPIIIYGYTPSLGLAGTAAALFFIAFVIHLYFVIKYRSWSMIPLTIGTLLEIVGYVARSLASKNPYNLIYFIIQYFFIVVAPVMFSASIYTILSGVIKVVGRQYSPFLPPAAILWIFIVADVICTGVQVAGAALIGVAESNRNDPTTANNILLIGLAVQVFAFFVFLVLLSVFLFKVRKMSRSTMMPFTIAYIIAALAIYLRTVFRLAETAQGLQQELSTNEVYFGCLEFAPVVVAVYLFLIFHPGKWVPRYG